MSRVIIAALAALLWATAAFGQVGTITKAGGINLTGTPGSGCTVGCLVAHSNPSISGSGSSTLTSSWTVNATGDAIIIEVAYCGNFDCTAQGADPSAWYTTSITYSGGSCSLSPGTQIPMSSTPSVEGDIWYCPNMAASGTVTFTFTMGGNVFYPTVFEQELRGVPTSSLDVGIANTAQTTTATSLSLTTNGDTTQSNQFVVSFVVSSTAQSSITINGTALDNSPAAGCASQYFPGIASGNTVTATYTLSTTPNVSIESIAAFKHN